MFANSVRRRQAGGLVVALTLSSVVLSCAQPSSMEASAGKEGVVESEGGNNSAVSGALGNLSATPGDAGLRDSGAAEGRESTREGLPDLQQGLAEQGATESGSQSLAEAVDAGIAIDVSADGCGPGIDHGVAGRGITGDT